MAKLLMNKVAIITGSTDGIGYSIAERFLREGSKVIISSRKSKNVDYAIKSLSKTYDPNCMRGVICNVGIPQERRNLLSEAIQSFGKVDILVSNVATNIHFGPALECTEDIWDKIFNVNLKSAFFLIKESIPLMNKKASIIVTSSLAGYIPFPSLGIYSLTKTALNGMVKVLSQELADSPLQIRINGIAPGIIKTKFSKMLHENQETNDEYMKQIHLKRFGTGEDCAGVVSFLASEDADYITGEIIVVAGGMMSHL